MQTARKSATLQYWTTPAIGVAIGLVYLIGFSIGGHPGNGVFGLCVMVGFSAVLVLLSRRSETVRGLLDRRDERIAGIDLQATAFTALAMIITVLTGFMISVAHGDSGWPYTLIGAIGGLAYLAALGYYRIRR
jgi:hypothetical protein